MDVLADFPELMNELINSFFLPAMYGNDIVGFTQYIFWLIVAIVIMLLVLFAARDRMSLVPRGRFINGVEYVVEFVRNDVVLATIGPKGEKHAPFLLTLFFFILFNNVVGIIPGCKPGTGTIGVTCALGTCSFVYFVSIGVKHMGALGYIKNFAPKGVMTPLAVLVGLIEAFSTFLRLITLAVRLFANMFAGHLCLGAFALLASLFCMPVINAFTASNLATAIPSIMFILILIVLYLIEMLVAVVQAYVFTLLSAVYIQLVEAEH